ncbi:hypothetical protein QBC35DRAFT_503770 [Podospora australis]|uniref:Uncharacterized protein n=1 Tax=Podospora australis TaxID=1536484 RepID=A0AAN6WQ60_9PEZI|nr:hypothetical protein QBC35DRAFT_503770 [Podospora australis]
MKLITLEEAQDVDYLKDRLCLLNTEMAAVDYLRQRFARHGNLAVRTKIGNNHLPMELWLMILEEAALNAQNHPSFSFVRATLSPSPPGSIKPPLLRCAPRIRPRRSRRRPFRPS